MTTILTTVTTSTTATTTITSTTTTTSPTRPRLTSTLIDHTVVTVVEQLNRKTFDWCDVIRRHTINNTRRECEFAVRNEGITDSSPFLNDTKNCFPLTKLMAQKNTQKFEGSGMSDTGLKYSLTIGLALLLTALHCQKR